MLQKQGENVTYLKTEITNFDIFHYGKGSTIPPKKNTTTTTLYHEYQGGDTKRGQGVFINVKNKLGLSCAKLSTARAAYPLAKQLEQAISLC